LGLKKIPSQNSYAKYKKMYFSAFSDDLIVSLFLVFPIQKYVHFLQEGPHSFPFTVTLSDE
jgi:hypothetical protein